MSDVVIRVENLSKQYRLGTVGTGTLAHDLNRWWARVRGRPDPTLKVTEANIRDRKAEGRAEGGKLKAEGSAPDSSLQVSGFTPHPLEAKTEVGGPRSEVGSPRPEGGRGSSASVEAGLRRDTPSPDSAPGMRSPLPSPPSVPSAGRYPHHSPEYVWALKDINFEVKRGEVLGIIGRNGAGKSTLLKILSRITAPTEGQVGIKGRVGSLLEVGTGFHPELTGRENIFLNGAILGMTKAEIAAKLDEIVDFSGCERYLDTPVKRYSSGMMVRLGFAVAAHLEPEILIVDEVLAVGDAEFQKKCIGKMQDVAGHGRTILFVSHSMSSISTLCPRSILLVNGSVGDDGPSGEVIVTYLEATGQAATGTARHGKGDDVCHFLSAVLTGRDGRPTHEVELGSPVTVSMVYRVTRLLDGSRLVPNFHFYTATGVCAFVANCPGVQPGCHPGTYSAECRIPAHFLNEGGFSVGFAVTSYAGDSYRVHFDERNVLFFNVRDPKVRDGYSYGYVGPVPGVVRPRLEWEVKRVD